MIFNIDSKKVYPIPDPDKTFSYTGEWAWGETSGNDWIIRFLTSGTLTIKKLSKDKGIVDVFCVGGGGGGHGSGTNIGGGGSGGGYGMDTITLEKGKSYSLTIGAGGGARSNGGDTTFNGLITGYGGKSGSRDQYVTVKGGSLKGGSGGYCANYGDLHGKGGDGYAEFDEPGGTIKYGGGGSGASACGYDVPGGAGGGGTAYACFQAPYNVQAFGGPGGTNTGGGGGGAWTADGASGGSGIIVLRNHRE